MAVDNICSAFRSMIKPTHKKVDLHIVTVLSVPTSVIMRVPSVFFKNSLMYFCVSG